MCVSTKKLCIRSITMSAKPGNLCSNRNSSGSAFKNHFMNSYSSVHGYDLWLRIAIIWAVSVLLALPHSMFNRVVTVTNPPYTHSRRCRAIYPDWVETNFPQKEIMLSFVAMLTQFLIPLSITGVLYTRIARIIQHQGRMALHFNDQLNRRMCELKRKRIMMLILVVSSFGVSWLPLTLYHLVIDLHLVHFNQTTFLVFHLIAMSSLCFNPFIYTWMNELYRTKVKHVFNSAGLLLTKAFICCPQSMQNKSFADGQTRHKSNTQDPSIHPL